MAIPREALQRAIDAGHADNALVALPVSLLREIMRILPVETIPVCPGACLPKQSAA
jgi:hypothetical protein